MSKLLNQLYTTRWYLNQQIENLEKGQPFDSSSQLLSEMKTDLAVLLKSISNYTLLENDKELRLWYPHASIPGFRQKTNGKYSKQYPKGLVVHWIMAPQIGGKENAEFWAKWGKDMGYTFFTIGNDGSVVQSFPLNEYGSHAGKSYWKNIGDDVSDQLVGVEIVCEGKVQKFADGRFGHVIEQKDAQGNVIKTYKRYVNEADVVYIDHNTDNISKGYYQKYTQQQEEALLKLILWLKVNNPDVFNLDYVLGHDEVAGPTGLGTVDDTFKNSWRKTDPGGSLSMSMPKFRELLKAKYTAL